MDAPRINAPILSADVEAILIFLPKLEKLLPGNIWKEEVDSSVEGDAVAIEHRKYNSVVYAFEKSLYRRGFIRDFDWPTWMPKAQSIFENPALLHRAPMGTCVRHLTLHVRNERFCVGHLGAMLEAGHITAILRRMGYLVSQRPKQEEASPVG
jgi:hypothetical protein